jgi:hypothetical protein
MKKMIYVLIFVVLSTITLEAKPKLVFSTGYILDFGLVRQKDSPLKSEVTLYNKGTDTLIIERIKPNCGCTTAPLSKKVLPPGDSAILKVTFNVEHYEHEIEKRILFKTNYSFDDIVLYLRANVYKPVSLFPGKYFNLSQMFIGEETISKIIITNHSGRDLNIKNIVNTSEDLELNVKVGDIIPKDTDFVVEAKVKPIASGPYSTKIDITIDDADMPVIQLSGFGRVDPVESKAKDYHKVEDPLIIPENIIVNPPVINQPATYQTIESETNTPIRIQPGEITPIEAIPNVVLPDNQIKVPPLPPQNEMMKQNHKIKVVPLPIENEEIEVEEEKK